MDRELEEFIRKKLEIGLKVTDQEPHKYRGCRVYYSIHVADKQYKLIFEIERKKITEETGEKFTFRVVEIIRYIRGRKEKIGSSVLNKKLIYEENQRFGIFSKRDPFSLNGTLYLVPNENLQKVF